MLCICEVQGCRVHFCYWTLHIAHGWWKCIGTRPLSTIDSPTHQKKRYSLSLFSSYHGYCSLCSYVFSLFLVRGTSNKRSQKIFESLPGTVQPRHRLDVVASPQKFPSFWGSTGWVAGVGSWVVDRTKNNRSSWMVQGAITKSIQYPGTDRPAWLSKVACHLLVTNAHFLEIILVDDLQKKQRYPLWVVCFWHIYHEPIFLHNKLTHHHPSLWFSKDFCKPTGPTKLALSAQNCNGARLGL